MANPHTGQVTISASPQRLSGTITTIDEYIVKVPSTNAGPAYVGDSAVTTSTGHILEPGDTLTLVVDVASGQPKFEVRPHELYVVGTAGDKISWFG
jgi:hypothetical protein